MDSLTFVALKACILDLFSNKKLVAQLFGAYGVYKAIYFLFLDPLRKIPGPWWARFTSLPYEVARLSGETVSFSNKLHKSYGPTARVGPRNVSISDPKDIRLVLSSYRYPKSKLYENGLFKQPSLFSTTNEQYNRNRRRQVGPAFSNTGLDTVEDLVLKAGIISLKKKIEKEIEAGNGEYFMNYYNLFQSLTADVIGELAFGKSFDAVAQGGHPIVGWVNSAIVASGFKQAFPILKTSPYLLYPLTRDVKKMLDFTLDAIKKRKELIKNNQYQADRIDILQTYLTSVNPDGSKLLDLEVAVEEILMLAAGTDTTSVTMSWLLQIYTVYPHVFEKVLNEINDNFPDKSKIIRYKEAREKLPYFVATVYECMRIAPAVNGAMPRDSSDDGVQLSTSYIPKDVTIMVYSEGAHRKNTSWKSPEKFIPERFLGEEASKNTKELFTFSSGVRICPGRNLAWMEILTVIPNILRDYDIKLPADALYRPDVLDPERSYEPKLLKSKAFITRVPLNPKRDCNVIITKNSS